MSFFATRFDFGRFTRGAFRSAVAVTALLGSFMSTSGCGDGNAATTQEQRPPAEAGTPSGKCQIFPPDNFWHTPIDAAPVHPNSDQYIASIGGDVPLHPDFGAPWDGAPNGIPYDVVPADQAKVNVSFDYDDESDPGPYPIPPNAQIEGGADGDGDRHVLVVQQGTCLLYEMFDAHPQADGSWHAGSGAIWDLDQNQVRTQGWTSADAAGLAILPGLVRYDEVMQTGEIRHAIRVTLSSIQRSFILPATHSDGRCGTDPSCPPMGLRLRLKASFDDTGMPSAARVIVRAMKKYGLVVADTGSDLFLSGVPDDRWDDDALRDLRKVHGRDLEAVYMGDPIPY